MSSDNRGAENRACGAVRIGYDWAVTMSAVLQSPLVRLALSCAVLVMAVYLVVRPSDDAPSPATADPRSSSSAASSVFGPAPSSGPGVVTIGGTVLPVVGGGEGEWQVLTPCARTVVVDGTHIAGAHVVLDPGHGGRETGAVGPTGVVEAELNLDVAGRVAERLEDMGATVVLTRRSDERVTLTTRAAIADALDPLVFVSIHHNSGPTSPSDEPGVQVFHQQDEPESARLAGVLWEELRSAFTPFSDQWSAGLSTGVRARLSADGDDYYGVLRGSDGVPAVLIEALYLSSEPEATLLADDAIRDAEADAIAAAVVDWLGTDRPGSGFIGPLVAEESAGGGGGTDGCVDPPGLTGP